MLVSGAVFGRLNWRKFCGCSVICESASRICSAVSRLAR